MRKFLASCLIVGVASLAYPDTTIFLRRAAAAGGFTQDFNAVFATYSGNWSFSGTWGGDGTYLISPASGTPIAVYSAGATSTSDQCVCVEDQAAAYTGVGLRMAATAAGGYHYTCGFYTTDAYVFEWNGVAYLSDVKTESAGAFTYDADDVLCCSVTSTEHFKLYFHNEGGSSVTAQTTGCTANCLIGESGDGCTNNWVDGTAISGNATSNTHCGVGGQGGGQEYDTWTCDDYP